MSGQLKKDLLIEKLCLDLDETDRLLGKKVKSIGLKTKELTAIKSKNKSLLNSLSNVKNENKALKKKLLEYDLEKKFLRLDVDKPTSIKQIVTSIYRVTLRKKELRSALAIAKSDLFDAEWYLSKYRDVADSGINPIIHFLRYGTSELRNPSQKFDTRWYLNTYNEVARSGLNPLLHYLQVGSDLGYEIKPVKV